jgi:hypothetical protein
LTLKSIVGMCVLALPACAQYAGPAILSRGDAPAAMNAEPVQFRPYFEVSAVYDTGLAGVGVNSQGKLGTVDSAGVQLAGGISGSHSWRHTVIGLDYHGNINHWEKATYYDTFDQFLNLGIKHQFSRHVSLSLRESAGLFDQYFNLGAIQEALPYDPSQTTLPTTNFFDNRTEYVNSQADLIYQRSTRLSFDFGGGGYVNRLRSTALYGVNGVSATGDVQYRLTRRATIGANYRFEKFTFTRIFGASDLHSFAGTFAIRLSKTFEFSGYGGVTRLETKFVQEVPVDPAIAALLGISFGQQVSYGIHYTPDINARLSRTVHDGLFYISGGHLVTPGNGLFLTSQQTTFAGGYNYTGLRRWSFSLTGVYNNALSIGNISGTYGNEGGYLNASRQIAHNFHVVVAFAGNRYFSNTFAQYNRPIYEVRMGFGWSPGDIPLRVW